MSKKILQIDGRMARASGIGTHIRNILPRLRRHLPGWRIRAICRDSSVGEAWTKQGSLDEYHVNGSGYYSPQLWLDPTVVRLANNASVWWAPHFVVPPFGSSPVLATFHDCAHLDCLQTIRVRAIGYALMALASAKAQRIVTVSNFSKGRIVDWFPKAAPKIAVIPNGVENDWFDETEPFVWDRPYAVIVGNHKPNKNLAYVVNEFVQFGKLHQVDLLIVGKTGGFSSDNSQWESWSHLEFVKVMGELSFEKLRSCVAGAVCLISGSLYEGFSLPPLEAMASGTPVVLSDIGVHREYYNCVGHFFDPRSSGALARVLEASWGAMNSRTIDARSQLRAIAKNFDWERASLDIAREIVGISF